MSSEAKSLFDDMSGYNLGEKKAWKDFKAASWADVSKPFTSVGISYDINIGSLQTISAGKDLRTDTARAVDGLNKYTFAEYATVFTKFCSNADFKEAVCDAVKSVVFEWDVYDESKPRVKFEIKDKVLHIVLNAAYSEPRYWSDPHSSTTLSDFLEKSL